MNEIVIKKHNFELAKNRLKDFSEKREAELSIDRVKTDGGFLGLGDHKVTGYELNNRIETIQNHLIDINSTNNKTIKEFREIYNALEALDKDYITSIVASIKAIEKTSNDVKIQQGVLSEHNNKLQKQQNKLDAQQGEIEKILDKIKKTVSALNLFKEKLDGFKHLTDIDIMWKDCKMIRNEIQVVSDSITKLSKKTIIDIETASSQNKVMVEKVNKNINLLNNDIKTSKGILSDLSSKVNKTVELLDGQILIIQNTSNYVNQIRNIEHLNEVDIMWNDINEAKESFNSIKKDLQNIDKNISKVQGRLNELDEYVAVLKDYIHLQDIDIMWEDLADVKINTKKLFKDIADINDIEHLNEVDFMWKQGNLLQDGLSMANKDIVSLQQKAFKTEKSFIEYKSQTENVLAKFEKKIKYAYLIAGGSLGFAILELILIMVGVI